MKKMSKFPLQLPHSTSSCFENGSLDHSLAVSHFCFLTIFAVVACNITSPVLSFLQVVAQLDFVNHLRKKFSLIFCFSEKHLPRKNLHYYISFLYLFWLRVKEWMRCVMPVCHAWGIEYQGLFPLILILFWTGTKIRNQGIPSQGMSWKISSLI